MQYPNVLRRSCGWVWCALALSTALVAAAPRLSFAAEAPSFDASSSSTSSDMYADELLALSEESPTPAPVEAEIPTSDSESDGGTTDQSATSPTQGDTIDAGDAEPVDAVDETLPDTDASDAGVPAVDVPEEGADVPTEEALEDALPEAGAQDAQSDGEDPLQQEAPEDQKVLATAASQQLTAGAKLPSGAASIKEGTYYIETGLADNQVLGVSERKGNAAVSSCTYDGSATSTQTWYVVKDSATGWYLIYLQNKDGSYVLGKHKKSNKAVLLTASKLDEIGERALWAFVPNGSWYNLVNRSLPKSVLRFDDGATKAGSAASLGEMGSTKKTHRFYLLAKKPKVGAGERVSAGAYVASPQTNGNLAVETRGAKSDDNANVWLYTSNGKNHQKLYLEADGDGYYIIWVVGTGKVLAQESSSVIPGNNVLQKRYDASAATQRWALRTFSDGTYALVNKATGLALGAKGSSSKSNLVGTRNDGYKTTRFSLKRKALLSAGIVEIHPRTSSAVTLDVRGASTKTSSLLLWSDKDALNQRFELVSAGKTDHWRIRTASSGGWITYTDAESAVVQQKGKGSDAKTKANTWQVVFKGGWYSLINVASGKALDMRKGKTDAGTQVIAYKPNGKDSQHFTIVPATLVTPGYYSLQNGGERYMAVKGRSRKEGANIQVHDETDSIEQLFQFEKNGSTWSIQNALSELYLTVQSAEKGATVKQNEWTGAKKQLWQMQIADGGFIAIKSAADSSLGLVAYKAGANDGADVYVTTAAQNTAQSWKPVSFSEGELTQLQERVLISCMRTPSPGAGYCAAWVTNVFSNAGIGYWGGDACDQYRRFCKSSNLSQLKVGMIVAVSTHGHTQAGSIYGHVGIYVGNGLIMDNVGSIRTMSVHEWISYYSDRVAAKWGWFGKSLV